jgi:hypothetical protein
MRLPELALMVPSDNSLNKAQIHLRPIAAEQHLSIGQHHKAPMKP